MTRALRAVSLVTVVSACAYYNAMWSAERFAREARRLEARGREPEARSEWARAAQKAESVMARHPRSRWADDALVLSAEGRARAGMCDVAAAPIAQALRTVGDAALRERAASAAAHCALLAAGRTAAAAAAAAPETPGRAFRAAELARDSGATRRAGRLFLDLAAANPTSLFAPKALVAALPLLPDRHDSIIGVLDAAYAGSPYTRALRGEASAAYAAAEDSLARELGVQLGRGGPVSTAGRGGIAPSPLTGPRGPWLERR
jgi:hypothetical protein